MTKVEALAEFREHYAPAVRATYGRGDVPAMREEWNNYIDSLEKEKRITPHQAYTWTNPF